MDYEIEIINRQIQEIDERLEMFRENSKVVELEKFVERKQKEFRALGNMKKTRTSKIIELLQKRINAEFWENCRSALKNVEYSEYSLDISLNLIDDLIARGYCICGKSLDEDENCKKELYRLRESISPVNTNHLVAGIYKNCRMHAEPIDEISEMYARFAKDLFLIEEEIGKVQDEVSLAEMKLGNSPFNEEISILKRRRGELISERDEIKIKIMQKKRMAELRARKDINE